MIKYFCDSCDKQVFGEDGLYTCNIPRKTTYGSVSGKWDICEHCLNKVNNLLKYSKIEEPCDTVVSSK